LLCFLSFSLATDDYAMILRRPPRFLPLIIDEADYFAIDARRCFSPLLIFRRLRQLMFSMPPFHAAATLIISLSVDATP
jgi:hypothetical protein